MWLFYGRRHSQVNVSSSRDKSLNRKNVVLLTIYLLAKEQDKVVTSKYKCCEDKCYLDDRVRTRRLITSALPNCITGREAGNKPVLPGDNSDTVPPDPIPNSEVKRVSGDGSVGIPHVRVAHCQAPN